MIGKEKKNAWYASLLFACLPHAAFAAQATVGVSVQFAEASSVKATVASEAASSTFDVSGASGQAVQIVAPEGVVCKTAASGSFVCTEQAVSPQTPLAASRIVTDGVTFVYP